jgi:SAM-dependent methyltransferase
MTEQIRDFRVDVRSELSSERLRDVQEAFDPLSIARLDGLAGPGASCLVVGEGRRSTVAWLRGCVSESGRVDATDSDPLVALSAPYDLVTSRNVLMYQPDPRAMLEGMVKALRPGGWLVVEEGDFDEPVVVTREHPAAGAFERVWHATTAFLSDVLDVRLGTRLPRLGWGLGLTDFHVEAHRNYGPGGNPPQLAMKLALDMFRGQLLGSTALWEDDLDMATAALEDPSFVCGSPLSYALFGRRPI